MVITDNRSIMEAAGISRADDIQCFSVCVVGPQCILPEHFELLGRASLQSIRCVVFGKRIGALSIYFPKQRE